MSVFSPNSERDREYNPKTNQRVQARNVEVSSQQDTYLACHKHKNEEYTNFCCIKYCLSALCPDCIDEHNKDHKKKGEFPEFDTLKRMHAMCLKQVQGAEGVVQEEIRRLSRLSSMSIDQIILDAKRELSESKGKIYRSIDVFYDEIMAGYEETVRKAMKQSFDFRDVERELAMALEELKSLETELNSDKHLVSSIKRVCTLDMMKFIKYYQERVRKSIGNELYLPFDVQFNERDYPDMISFLKRYLRYKHTNVSLNERELQMNHYRRDHLSLQDQEANQYLENKLKN